MNYCDMFNMLGSIPSPEQDTMQQNNDFGFNGPRPYEPTFYDQPPLTDWDKEFMGFKTRPVLYNVDGWISPYSSNNWGGTSNILQYLDDQSRLPAIENKIDPNKIFSSEINGLRALASDQQKIVKMFEKKLMESLTEKGKFGLTEADVEAMSALTSARTAITAISKEQVNIKKNIAEIKIKQNQNANVSTNSTGNTQSVKGANSNDIGRSILDNIFDSPAISQSTSVNYNAQSVSNPSSLIDNIVPSVNPMITYESNEPKTYVVIGETDADIDFETYSANGELIPDFPKPNARVTTIDRESMKATDEFLVQYPIKYK